MSGSTCTSNKEEDQTCALAKMIYIRPHRAPHRARAHKGKIGIILSGIDWDFLLAQVRLYANMSFFVYSPTNVVHPKSKHQIHSWGNAIFTMKYLTSQRKGAELGRRFAKKLISRPNMCKTHQKSESRHAQTCLGREDLPKKVLLSFFLRITHVCFLFIRIVPF